MLLNFTRTKKTKDKINKNKDVEIPLYSKKGIYIAYNKYDKKYWKFVFFRVFAFLIDFIIPGTIQFIVWSILQSGFIISGLATLIYYHIYYFIILVILQGRTIGMVPFRLRVIHKSGFLTNSWHFYFRAFVMSVYALPFIGWGLMLLNFLSLFLLKGITLFDLISSTIVISEEKYQLLKRFEEMEKNSV